MPADKQRTASREHGVSPYARPYACPCCPAAFAYKSGLATHMRTVHLKRRDHVCPRCAAAFGDKSNLARHLRTIHSSIAESDVACHSAQPGVAARVRLSADYIVDALLS